MAKSSFWDHPIEKLEEALQLKKQIHALQTKLSSLFGGDAEATTSPAVSAPKGRRGPRGKRSPETRARMAAAQRARWAARNGVKSTATVAVKAKKSGKRKMSAEARERIAAAQRARWAKARGEKA